MNPEELGPEITAIWQDVLGVGSIDPDADFFALGGQSLAAMKMVTRVKVLTGASIKLSDVFRAPTLQGFTELVRSRTPAVSRGSDDQLTRRAPR
jgi:aryl carrier-like protein